MQFAEKLQTIAENMQRNDHLPMKDNAIICGGEKITRIRPKHQRFKSQEDIPNELRDDFLYLEVSLHFLLVTKTHDVILRVTWLLLIKKFLTIFHSDNQILLNVIDQDGVVLRVPLTIGINQMILVIHFAVS